jgi:hypothetical protein
LDILILNKNQSINEMSVYKFYQEEDGRWYIDLPEYIQSGLGTKANLEMVAGADVLMSEMAQGKSEITLKFTETEFNGYQVQLIRSSNYGYAPEGIDDIEFDTGGWYHYYEKRKWYQLRPKVNSLWLCPVTLFLFNNPYPENIFIENLTIFS